MKSTSGKAPAAPTASEVVCLDREGCAVHGTLLRLGRHDVAFQVHAPTVVLQVSQLLEELRIAAKSQTLYRGQAVVTNLVELGQSVVCEASLSEEWCEADLLGDGNRGDQLRTRFEHLLQEWQGCYAILPEYKLAVADISSLLVELREWMEPVEMAVRAAAKPEFGSLERTVVGQLTACVTASLNPLFEKFELAAGKIDVSLRPVHALYVKRQLHPLLMCSPFMHRIYRKPLGYAGDYEMVNMILRDPEEGATLYAKILNSWFLSQPPAEAHRNRVKLLTERLLQETLRARAQGKVVRVLNIGCGPAQEVQNFMRESELSNQADFTLLDFNEETLEFASRKIGKAKARYARTTPHQFVKKSVARLLKEGLEAQAGTYDLIYCAGLFDYLSDGVCKQLHNSMFDMLAPGGLLLTTNVHPCNPILHIMGLIFDWHLIYRDGKQLAVLAPDRAAPDDVCVTSDATGNNVFLEVRKPRSKP